MSRKSDKRERLISAADALISRQGFHRTTLAHIAEESGVPLGNVYYYFKTKEEICEAVIKNRKDELSRMLGSCCRQSDPKQALINMVEAMISHSEELAKAGCPLGNLCQELDEEFAELMNSADSCMKFLLEWSTEQFQRLGLEQAEDLGFQFVARVQGVALMGNVLGDAGKLATQLEAVVEWIEGIEPARQTTQAGRREAA